VLGGGTVDAVAPYIGAAAAVPHGGMFLLPWATTGATLTAVGHDGRLPRGSLRTVGHLTAVDNDSWRCYRLDHGSRRGS
jgi:hypothetical protein